MTLHHYFRQWRPFSCSFDFIEESICLEKSKLSCQIIKCQLFSSISKQMNFQKPVGEEGPEDGDDKEGREDEETQNYFQKRHLLSAGRLVTEIQK